MFDLCKSHLIHMALSLPLCLTCTWWVHAMVVAVYVFFLFKHDFSNWLCCCVACLIANLFQSCAEGLHFANEIGLFCHSAATLVAMARSFQCPVCRGRVASCFTFSRSRVVDRSFDWCSLQPQTDNLLINTLPPSRIMTGIGRFERWLSFGLSAQA